MSLHCWICQSLVEGRYDLFEKRVEFRRRSDQARWHVVLLGRVCRGCADAAIEAFKDPAEGEKVTCNWHHTQTMVCGEPAVYERRIEYRRKSDDGRYRVLLDGWRCETHAQTDLEILRPPAEPAGIQETLL